MDPSCSRNPSNQRAAGEHARTIDAHSTRNPEHRAPYVRPYIRMRTSKGKTEWRH